MMFCVDKSSLLKNVNFKIKFVKFNLIQDRIILEVGLFRTGSGANLDSIQAQSK